MAGYHDDSARTRSSSAHGRAGPSTHQRGSHRARLASPDKERRRHNGSTVDRESSHSERSTAYPSHRQRYPSSSPQFDRAGPSHHLRRTSSPSRPSRSHAAPHSRTRTREDDRDGSTRGTHTHTTRRALVESASSSAEQLAHSPPHHAAPAALPTSIATVKSLLPSTSVATCILPLDAKLIELLYAISPTSSDRDARVQVMEEVRDTIQRAGLDIQIYGSLCTGLVIPASDVDCVMLRSTDPRSTAALTEGLAYALQSLDAAETGSMPQKTVRGALSTGIRTAAERLRRRRAFKHVTCIAHAKVPIVKCVHEAEGIKVDLSFEKDGCVSSNYLCELFCEPGNELARPLIVLVKALVSHCGLSDPSTGGLGSFPISLLVLWYLKECVTTRFAAELQHSIAVLFVGFLKYYGTEFDSLRQGIDYVQQKTFAKAPANELFIVNPLRPGTNCARAATLFASRVVPHFRKAAEAFSPLLVMDASPVVMEQRLLHFFANALPHQREWREVSRAAAAGTRLPQNMWDKETNMYMGGVL